MAAGVETEPVAEVTAPPPDGGRGGRIVLLVLGSIAALFAFATLAGGCALVAIDQTQRDDDGFLMSPSEDLSTPTYAIVSESAELDTERRGVGARHVPRHGPHPERERAAGLRRHRAPGRRCGVPRRRGARPRVRLRLRGRPPLRARARRCAGGATRRPDVLGRERLGSGRADARVGARGRRLAGRAHERGRVTRRLVRASRSAQSSTRCSGSGSRCSASARCSPPLAALAVTAGIRRGRRPGPEERQGST